MTEKHYLTVNEMFGEETLAEVIYFKENIFFTIIWCLAVEGKQCPYTIGQKWWQYLQDSQQALWNHVHVLHHCSLSKRCSLSHVQNNHHPCSLLNLASARCSWVYLSLVSLDLSSPFPPTTLIPCFYYLPVVIVCWGDHNHRHCLSCNPFPMGIKFN